MSGASTAETPGHAGTATAGGSVLVIGLGNPLLGDDGVGWRVVGAVEAAVEAGRGHDVDGRGVVFDCLAVGGLALMERLVGARRAVLVDAVVTGEDPPGTVRVLDLAAVPGREATHLDSAHDVSLVAALAAGRALGASLPDDIAVVTVEAARVGEFSESMTPEVEAAVPATCARVLGLLADR